MAEVWILYSFHTDYDDHFDVVKVFPSKQSALTFVKQEGWRCRSPYFNHVTQRREGDHPIDTGDVVSQIGRDDGWSLQRWDVEAEVSA